MLRHPRGIGKPLNTPLGRSAALAKRVITNQFQWLSALPLLLLTGLLAIVALGAVAGAHSPDARAREALFDYFQRIAPAPDAVAAAADVFHVVEIDQAAIDAVGPWPWPRTLLADLVNSAYDAGATAVILAEPVDSPDPLSPETIGAFWLSGAGDEALAQQLARLPRTDIRLAAAFARAPGAIAVAADAPGDPHSPDSFQRTDARGAAWLDAGGARYLALPGARYVYALTPALGAAARPAVAALEPDGDGTLRRAPLLWSLDGAPAPSIALEAARLAAARNGAQSVVALEIDQSTAHSQGEGIKSLTVGGVRHALSETGAIRLYPPRRLRAPTTSAARILDGASSNSQLRDRVVVIGRSADLAGAVVTARGPLAPAEAHALAAAQLYAGASPKRPIWTGYVEALAVMMFGAGAIMIGQRMAFWPVVALAGLAAAALLAGAFAAFSLATVLVNPLPPVVALFIGALSVAGGKSIGGALRDDSVRGAFHDALPEPVMQRLREDRTGALLNGVKRDITVLACELRLADDDLRQLENLPEDVAMVLAAASNELRHTILDTGGAADQADGGRVFAYYNAPMEHADHIQTGCAAALRLIESMDKINEDLDAASRTRGVQVHLAIGVAVGPCFAGPMGQGRNNRYSAVGDAVDRAAFLRNQSAYYGPAMICDEAVYRATHHHFAFLELDKIRTRNAERPFSIYALIGNPFIKSSKGFRALDDAHRAFLKSYRAGDLAAARALLDKTQATPGAAIALFDIYRQRLDDLAKTGVPENWDGAQTAEA